MITHKLVQGSPEWLAHRAEPLRRNASEAPAMMGASKLCTRNELLHAKATCTQKEFSDFVQRFVLDKGHAVEASTRPMVEEALCEDLHPISVSDDDGYLSASLDGSTECMRLIWECKQWNESKAATVESGAIPEEDKWQVVQQLVITGAEQCIYSVSDGTPDRYVEVRYSLQPTDEKRLRAGWKQFDEDLANYVPEERKPDVVAEPVKDLPAVFVEVKGSVAVQNNFSTFEKALRHFIDDLLIKAPETDQDFADLDLQIKALKKAEDALNSAESYMLAQIQEVSDLKSTKDMLFELARKNRLASEKLLASEKDRIKLEIRDGAVNAFAEHIRALNKRLGNAYMPAIATDFPGAMKNKRTLESLRNAVDTELARAKIAANETADLIDENLKSLRELASDVRHLFADVQQIILKPNDDLVSLIKARRADWDKQEAERLAVEREKIRKEEADRLEAEAAAKARAEELAAAEQAKAPTDPVDEPVIGVDLAAGPDETVEVELTGNKVTNVKTVEHASASGYTPHSATKATVVNKLELLKAIIDGQLPEDLVTIDMAAVTALCASKNRPIPGVTWGKA